jgi:hypothetical protein
LPGRVDRPTTVSPSFLLALGISSSQSSMFRCSLWYSVPILPEYKPLSRRSLCLDGATSCLAVLYCFTYYIWDIWFLVIFVFRWSYRFVIPITVAARSEAWTVFARSNAGVVGSNPTGKHGCVCVRLFCVVLSCVCSGLATGWSPVQGVLPTVVGLRNWNKAFHGCPMLQSGSNRKERERGGERWVCNTPKSHLCSFVLVSILNLWNYI